MRFVSYSLLVFAMCSQAALAEPDVPEAPAATEQASETPLPDTPPMPSYPVRAVRNKIQGRCVITFDVTATGQTENIRPACSDAVFCKESKRAMSAVTFPPALNEAGDSLAQKDLTYPLEYRLGGVSADPKDWAEPKACS